MKALVKKILICIYRILNVILPKSSKIAVFSTSNGKSAGGNPRAVYEYAVSDGSYTGYRFVWFLTDELMKKHPGEAVKLKEIAGKASCKIVRYGHPAYYWYLARAGIWVFDSRQEPYIVKRPGVKYLQTWHGTPLKKLGVDIDEMNMAGESGSIEAYKDAFRREAAQWDYLIAQNSFSAETFARCFDFHGKMLKIGYPRNDELVRAAQEGAREGMASENGTDRNIGKGAGRNAKARRTLLYAPTWRDDKYTGNGWYAYSSPLDFEKLHELLGDGFRIIVKPHYLVKMRAGDIPESMIRNGFVKICGHSEDINKLYLKADGLITDYSSAMFDYSLLGRPMFFYAYDMEEYAGHLRGFYFDLEEEAPGPICRTTEELGNAIKETFSDIDAPVVKAEITPRVEAFVRKYNTYDDGNAARKAWYAVTGNKQTID